MAHWNLHTLSKVRFNVRGTLAQPAAEDIASPCIVGNFSNTSVMRAWGYCRLTNSHSNSNSSREGRVLLRVYGAGRSQNWSHVASRRARLLHLKHTSSANCSISLMMMMMIIIIIIIVIIISSSRLHKLFHACSFFRGVVQSIVSLVYSRVFCLVACIHTLTSECCNLLQLQPKTI